MRLNRLRFSLLNLVLLTTIVALAVALWRNANEVVPLRNDVRSLRKELGDFTVIDSALIHVKQMRGVSNQVWKWRDYLPPGDYRLNAHIGVTDSADLKWSPVWLNRFRQAATGQTGRVDSGEMTLELAISEYGGRWWLRFGYVDKVQGTLQLKPSDGWLADLEYFEQLSDAGYLKVKSFDPKKQIVLLCVRRGTIRSEGGAAIAERPVGPAETLIIWIGQ